MFRSEMDRAGAVRLESNAICRVNEWSPEFKTTALRSRLYRHCFTHHRRWRIAATNSPFRRRFGIRKLTRGKAVSKERERVRQPLPPSMGRVVPDVNPAKGRRCQTKLSPPTSFVHHYRRQQPTTEAGSTSSRLLRVTYKNTISMSGRTWRLDGATGPLAASCPEVVRESLFAAN